MNCSEWEERLALYAGDDLSRAERAGVERHLSECAGCQVFLSGLTQGLDELRDAHAEPVLDVHFAAVRARVSTATPRRPAGARGAEPGRERPPRRSG